MIVDPIRKASFRSSLDLYIFPWLKCSEADKSEKTDACLMRYTRWSLKEFDEVCKSVQDTISYGRFPAPKEMFEHYEICSDRQGWRKKEQATDNVHRCSRCDGARFNDCYMKHKKDGYVYSACYPCPQCNSALKIETSMYAQAFIPATKEEFLEQRRINHEEYVAREEARRRQAPMLPATDYEMSPVAKQAVQNKAVIHDEIKPLEKALQGALTAPAPVKEYEEEVF